MSTASILRFDDLHEQVASQSIAHRLVWPAIAITLLTGAGLLMFFREMPYADLISSYGILFLVIHNDWLFAALPTLLLSLASIAYYIGWALYPEPVRERYLLAARSFGGALAAVVVYLYFTYPNTAVYMWSGEITGELRRTSEYRVFYTEFVFVLVALLSVNNCLTGLVAWTKRGDFFATNHLRNFLLNLLPATLAFISTLPFEAIRIPHLYYYVIGAAVGYLCALFISLYRDHGRQPAWVSADER